jgi:hypothetical protein
LESFDNHYYLKDMFQKRVAQLQHLALPVQALSDFEAHHHLGL